MIKFPAAILLLSLSFSTFAAAWDTARLATQDAKAHSVLRRYEQWRGGAKFRGLVALRSRGRLSVGGLNGTVETSSDVHHRVRRNVELGALQETSISNPDGVWKTNLSGQAQRLSAAEADDFRRDAALLFPPSVGAPDETSITLAPAEIADGVPVDVLRRSFSEGNGDDFLIAADGRLVAIRSSVKGRMHLTRYANWRFVAGVRMPFKEVVTGEVASDNSTTIYTRIDINPQTLDGLFKRPPTARIARFPRGQHDSGWLPFELFRGNRIFIPATVNGQKVNVLLDSGASATVLDRKFAADHGLLARGDLTAEGTGGGSTVSVLQGVDIALGAMRLQGVTAVGVDLAKIERRVGRALPVILGAEVFQDCVVDIDFAHHRIAFRDPEGFAPSPQASIVNATVADEVHVIEGSLEGRPVKLVFDLGNAATLDLFPRFWDNAAFASRPQSTTYAGGLGGEHVVKLAIAERFTLGNYTFPIVPVRLEGMQQASARSGRLDGNIGLPALSRFHLLVDFPHSRVLLEPPADTASPFRMDHTGLTLSSVELGLEVLYVAPSSPASRTSLKTGDVIVAVDGTKVASDGSGDGWRYNAPGTPVRLRLADGRDLTLTLARYF